MSSIVQLSFPAKAHIPYELETNKTIEALISPRTKAWDGNFFLMILFIVHCFILEGKKLDENNFAD